MRASLLLLCLLAVGCGSDGGGAQQQPDASVGPLVDAGPVDATGSSPDAAIAPIDARPADAAVAAIDAQPGADAAQPADAAPPADAPAGPDSGGLTLHLDVRTSAGGGTAGSAQHGLKLELGGVTGNSSSATHTLKLHP